MKEYYIFIDESGTPNLNTIDNCYPIFGLGALIFEKNYFNIVVLEKIKKLKTENGFSEDVILHSSDIRRYKKDFIELFNIEKRKKFFTDINEFFTDLDFKIFSSIIKKEELKERYPNPGCPYDLSLEFVLEKAMHFLKDNEGVAEIIIENREGGHPPLQKVFKHLKENGNGFHTSKLFQKHFPQEELEFVPKSHKGVQLSDMCIYPITTKILKPNKENPAFTCLIDKMYSLHFPEGSNEHGIKIFP